MLETETFSPAWLKSLTVTFRRVNRNDLMMGPFPATDSVIPSLPEPAHSCQGPRNLSHLGDTRERTSSHTDMHFPGLLNSWVLDSIFLLASLCRICFSFVDHDLMYLETSVRACAPLGLSFTLPQMAQSLPLFCKQAMNSKSLCHISALLYKTHKVTTAMILSTT